MNKYVYGVIGGLILLGLLAACVVFGLQVYKSPLAPILVLNTNSTETLPASPSKTPIKITVTAQSIDTSTPPPQVSTTQTSENKCGNGSMIILVSGGDDKIGNPPFGADFIRFVKIDYDQSLVSVVAVPRDLWVSGPMLSAKGYQGYRLGETYSLFKQSATGNTNQVTTAATTSLAQIIYENFGIIPDHYITVDFSTYSTMIDTIGGIDVNVKQPFDARQYGFVHNFQAGLQHFGGALTIEYVRAFDNEWNRQLRQNEVLLAIRNKLLEPANALRIPSLINQFSGSMTTSLSPEQIVGLTCLFKEIPQDRILYYAIAPDMVTTAPNNILQPNADKIKQFFKDTLGKPQ